MLVPSVNAFCFFVLLCYRYGEIKINILFILLFQDQEATLIEALSSIAYFVRLCLPIRNWCRHVRTRCDAGLDEIRTE